MLQHKYSMDKNKYYYVPMICDFGSDPHNVTCTTIGIYSNKKQAINSSIIYLVDKEYLWYELFDDKINTKTKFKKLIIKETLKIIENINYDVSQTNTFLSIFKKYSYEFNKYGDYWNFKIEKHVIDEH